MTKKLDRVYRSRMGFSWFGTSLPPERNRVSLTVVKLAERLEEVARELHVAYQNSETRLDNIVGALELLDVLQAQID